MKKKYFFFAAVALLALMATSCTAVSGLVGITDGTAIGSSNFQYIKTIKEDSKCIYVLGLGGANVEHNALENLKNGVTLEKGQLLTNYRVTTKTSFVALGLIVVKEVTIEADLIQFE